MTNKPSFRSDSDVLNPKDWIHSTIVKRETTFVISCLLFYTPTPFLKGVSLNKKEFSPFSFKSRPFSEVGSRHIYPFQKRGQNVFTALPSPVVYLFPLTYASRHMTFIQRRINVDATSWRCIDVDTTLSQRWVPTGLSFVWFSFFGFS